MRKKLRVILFSLFMMIFATACGKNKEIYDSGEDGFTSITSVEGISFDVVSDVSRNATAITNISEDMAFETDQTYMYKDGETEYFLFRIDSIVCVAQKGTSFGLKDAEDKLDAVTRGNILGIYFTSPRKKLEFVEDEKNGVYKMVATVTAQVALTSELYNDFAGRLAYIYDGKDEWTMFVGTIGKDFRDFSDETQEILTYMAATMSLHEEPVREQAPEPAISLGGDNEISSNVETVSSNVETVSGNETDDVAEDNNIEASGDEIADIILDESESMNSVQDKVESDPVTEAENAETLEDPDSFAETEHEKTDVETDLSAEPEEIEVEVIVEETPDDEQSDTDSVQDDIHQDTEEELEAEAKDEKTPNTVPNRGYIKLDNQKNTVKDDMTVYTSNIYDMLDVGKRAYADVLKSDASGYLRIEIKADQIHTGANAETIIKDAYNKGIMMGSYFAAPEGCTYHVIHYTVSFPEDNKGYVNVKLRGMDGENLRFRGISYTQRAYDIKVSDTEFYAFYAVPNACKEYVIEIGEGTIDNEQNGIVSAYYRFNGK